MPASARSTTDRHLGAGSTLATIGRPAARIEYIFDGTLDRARPAPQRYDVDVGRGEHLGEAIPRLHVDEADVSVVNRWPCVRGRRGPHRHR